jgi:hypothetical protein
VTFQAIDDDGIQDSGGIRSCSNLQSQKSSLFLYSSGCFNRKKGRRSAVRGLVVWPRAANHETMYVGPTDIQTPHLNVSGIGAASDIYCSQSSVAMTLFFNVSGPLVVFELQHFDPTIACGNLYHVYAGMEGHARASSA